MSNIVQKGTARPFVAGLRTAPSTIDLSRKGEQAITVRVEVAELWDAVRISVSPNEPVVTITRYPVEPGDLISAWLNQLDFAATFQNQHAAIGRKGQPAWLGEVQDQSLILESHRRRSGDSGWREDRQ